MRKSLFLAAAAGLAIAGTGAQATSTNTALFAVINGGVGQAGISSHIVPVKVDSKLYDYCTKVIDDVRRGKSSSSRSSQYSASDCIEIFINASIPGGITPAEPGQPGRGGDGGGIAGLPGGKGGAAGGMAGAGGAGGAPGQPGQDGQSVGGLPGGKGGAPGGASSSAAVDKDLLDYCSAVLKHARGATKKPAESDEYEPSDCVDYFASLDDAQGQSRSGATGSGARQGTAGPSISGGVGGRGGKPGAGPGGASGGAGGAGVGGGVGGKGGAGGSGY